MTRKIAGTCFAAVLGFALSAAAQTPTTPQTPPTTTPQTAPTSPYPSSQSADTSSHDKMGKSTKLTGCVQSGTTAGTFELTNIKGKGSMASSADAASSSASSSSSSSKTVKLVAAAGVDLSQHVGHQVEVTGSLGAGASASATAPSASSPSASASTSSDKEFNVTDVKMVSATCSAGTN
jgi:hypothetical protein